MSSSTTLLAVRFKSFVTTASDGRVGSARYGRPLKYNTRKSILVGTRACVSVSGDLSLISTLEEQLDTEQGVNAKQVAESVRKIITVLFKETRATNTVIVIGHGERGGFEIYMIESKWVAGNSKIIFKKINDRYVVKGSGESYLTTHMAQRFGNSKKNKNEKVSGDYDENMTEEEALKFVMDALNVAVTDDWGSGGLFRAVIINADGFLEKDQDQDNPPYDVSSRFDDCLTVAAPATADCSKKPLWPLSAFATHLLNYRQAYVQVDGDPKDIVQIGHLGRQSWNDLSKSDKRTASDVEKEKMAEYNDELENHVAYMKFMRACLHEKLKAIPEGALKKDWDRLEVSVKGLIRCCSVLKSDHTKIVLNEAEIVVDHPITNDDLMSRCPNLRMFFDAEGGILEESLCSMGHVKARQLEKQWDSLRYREMDLIALRSKIKSDQIFEAMQMDAKPALGNDDVMEDDKEEFWSKFPYLSKCLETKVQKDHLRSIDSLILKDLDKELNQLQKDEMMLQYDMSCLITKQVQDLAITVKKHMESESDEESKSSEDSQSFEDSQSGEENEPNFPNLSKSLEDWGFLMKNDENFMLEFLHWVDNNQKMEWEHEWLALQSREDEVKVKRLAFMDKLKGHFRG